MLQPFHKQISKKKKVKVNDKSQGLNKVKHDSPKVLEDVILKRYIFIIVIIFLCFGIITWGSAWITGYQDIAIFCFVLVGSLLGFLYFNSHPAKVFMGDTGSMALGATLAAVAILTKHELSLAVIGGVFVIETLSSIIQIYSIKRRGKKVFLMAPIHHHFEKLGWEETDIVKLFYLVGFGLGMVAVYYGVWM